MKTKRIIPSVSSPPSMELSEYERGYLDCLGMVTGIATSMQDQFRRAMNQMEGDASTSFLSGTANVAQNLLGALRAEAEKTAVRTLNEKRAPRSGGTESTR